MRIYVDESGTQGEDWLVIGMLFVPDHGALHSELCHVKTVDGYFNQSPKRKARFKETHLKECRSARDVRVCKASIDAFLASSAYFRCVVIDWSIWEGKYFGGPFEPAALKKRRAYKKWAEMLLHFEAQNIRGAELYLDRLLICCGYDVLENLEDRFAPENYQGNNPRFAKFELVDSWKDAHQCLQLTDLLVGCVYRKLVRPLSDEKNAIVNYLYEKLKAFGVRNPDPGFWRGYASNTLTKHFPKFSEWFWAPK